MSEGQENLTGYPGLDPSRPVHENNKRILLEALRAFGAVSATVSYQGYGDSGGAEDVSIVFPDGVSPPETMDVLIFAETRELQGTTCAPQTMSLEDALREYVEATLNRLHPGFENNEGGSGEARFTWEDDTIVLSHIDYYVESDHTETVL
ncbi:DUF6878 family protein [Cupriavidus malaysiensis]|uniref:DUF6878 domain-containing protein n=1 Tax=Cupriavidus malaysiensis TaxID=367825 RepID=A0ABM6FGN0_9BURK|nr:DUF6878 family protein [Cupriavidus malaysiensis]AOZ11112.1 hypothetical protein BKK80_34705 [Cupriavidus malaysiensis]